MNNFKEYYNKLNEEIIIDRMKDVYNDEIVFNIPIALNPSKNEFIKIAKDEHSQYRFYSDNDSGLRMLIMDFNRLNPNILVWPGGITHNSIIRLLKDYPDLNLGYPMTDFRFIWDSRTPECLMVEDPLTVQEYLPSDIERVKNAVNRLPIKITKILSNYKHPNDYEEFLNFDSKKDKIDIKEPEYATTIRQYHE
jgi:hypothetical protein